MNVGDQLPSTRVEDGAIATRGFLLSEDERKGKQAQLLAEAIRSNPGSSLPMLAALSGVPVSAQKRLFVNDLTIRQLVEAGMVAISERERNGKVLQRMIKGCEPMQGCEAGNPSFFPPLDLSRCPTEPQSEWTRLIDEMAGSHPGMRSMAQVLLRAIEVTCRTSRASARAEAMREVFEHTQMVSLSTTEEIEALKERCGKSEQLLAQMQSQLALITSVLPATGQQQMIVAGNA